MEQWKRSRSGKAQEYPYHRKCIEAWLKEGYALEGIASGLSEPVLGLLSRDMKRQARKMWREQSATAPVETLPRREAEPIYDDNERGWWKIEFVLDGYRGMGSLETVREKGRAKAVDLLREYSEGRIPFEEVFYLRAQIVKPHRKGPVDSHR